MGFEIAARCHRRYCNCNCVCKKSQHLKCPDFSNRNCGSSICAMGLKCFISAFSHDCLASKTKWIFEMQKKYRWKKIQLITVLLCSDLVFYSARRQKTCHDKRKLRLKTVKKQLIYALVFQSQWIYIDEVRANRAGFCWCVRVSRELCFCFCMVHLYLHCFILSKRHTDNVDGLADW